MAPIPHYLERHELEKVTLDAIEAEADDIDTQRQQSPRWLSPNIESWMVYGPGSQGKADAAGFRLQLSRPGDPEGRRQRLPLGQRWLLSRLGELFRFRSSARVAKAVRPSDT